MPTIQPNRGDAITDGSEPKSNEQLKAASGKYALLDHELAEARLSQLTDSGRETARDDQPAAMVRPEPQADGTPPDAAKRTSGVEAIWFPDEPAHPLFAERQADLEAEVSSGRLTERQMINELGRFYNNLGVLIAEEERRLAVDAAAKSLSAGERLEPNTDRLPPRAPGSQRTEADRDEIPFEQPEGTNAQVRSGRDANERSQDSSGRGGDGGRDTGRE